MTREDIIRMAREARMPYFYGTWEIVNVDGLERFAKLVAEHERERLAKPERPWVGLTDEELEAMAEKYVTNCYFDTLKYGQAIQSKIKEKNT